MDPTFPPPQPPTTRPYLRIAVIGALCGLVLLVSAFLVLTRPRSNLLTNPLSPTPAANAPASPRAQKPLTTAQQQQIDQLLQTMRTDPSIKSQVVRNLLINKTDLDRVHQDYLNSLQQRNYPTPSPTTPQHLQFQLAPGLKNPQTFQLFGQVHAASLCDAAALPPTVNAYSLRSHVTSADAQNLAKDYAIKSDTYSQPAAGGSFQYHFTDKGAFLDLYEASGLYNFHQIITAPAAPVAVDEAKNSALAALTKHGLQEGVTLNNTLPTADKYIFGYQKDWGLPVIDTLTLSAWGNKSVCGIVSGSTTNTIQLQQLRDGQLSELTNNVRQQLSVYSLPRQDLEASLNEFGGDPPIAPVVIPDGATVSGAVTITEAKLVYYDYGGPAFAQKFYLPMYLTSGTDTVGTRVLALLPAISAETIVSQGLSEKYTYENIGSTQQQGQIAEFKALTPPTPPIPTVDPNAPTGAPGAGGALCYGNLIDYGVMCTVGGVSVCSGLFSTGVEADPLNICKTGMQQVTGVMLPTSGDVCLDFLKSKNIPSDHYQNALGGTGGIKEAASCTGGAAPC